MSNNITIKDGNNANVTLHTIEDATSTHFNQSIPTDIANNTATVVSGGQAVASGMGALVVAQRDALPAGTNLIGGVSVRGISDVSVSPNGLNLPVSVAGTITVDTHAVTQSGSWVITSVNSRVAVSVENTNNIAVSIAPPTFNVPVSIANTLDVDVSVGTHPVTQSGTWNIAAITSINSRVAVSVENVNNIAVSLAPPAYNLPVSVHPVTQSGTWGVGLNAGTNLVGAVSIRQIVSVQPDGTANWPVSVATVGTPVDAFGAVPSLFVAAQGMVRNRNSNTWDMMTGTSLGLNVIANNVSLGGSTALIGSVSISPNGLNIPVSIAPPTFNLPVSVHPVTQSGTWNIAAITSINSRVAVSVENVNNIAVSIAPPTFNVPVSIAGALPAGTNHLGKVSVEGLSITGIGTQLVSVGGPVSVQGVQIVGRDGSGNARTPYIDASGIARVSIEGALTVTGGSMTHTVGTAVTTEGYPMLGSDGTNSRRLLTTTGGALIVHVSNTAPGAAASGSSMTQTVGAAVTTEGYPMLGSDGTSARRLLTTAAGAVVVHVSNLQPAISVAGIVSVVPDGTANWPVSIAPPTFNLPVSVHPVTQSGTWNVGVNAGTNLIGAVSVRQIVSVVPDGTANWPVSVAPPTFNLPVSVHPVTQSGTWNIGAITSINSRVAVSVENTNNIAVSVAPPTFNLPVSVHPVTQSGTWNVGALTSINSIVKVSIEGNLAVSGSSMTHTVGAAVTTEGYPMLGSDGTNSRRLLTTTGGALIVHVSNTAPGGSTGGSTQLVSVGGPVSTQGVQVVGVDGSGNARSLLTTTGGALVVHVSNSAPGGASGGGTPMVSVGGAVSTQGVQIVGRDNNGDARTIKTNVSGVTYITTRTFMSQDVFTRPADTTAYAAGATAAPGNAGDLIANSTTAGSVKPLKFRIAKGPGQVAYIRGARMYRTGGTLATGQHNIAGAIRLHLFNTATRVSVAGGDNAAFNASPVSNWMGYIDLVAIACAPGLRTSGAVSTQVYWGSPARTGEMIVNLSAAQVSIQGLLETRIAFTPISGEIFTVQIEGFNG